MCYEARDGVVVNCEEFDAWMLDVDNELRKQVGVVSGDLSWVPRVFFMGWFVQGYEPQEAAELGLDIAREEEL